MPTLTVMIAEVKREADLGDTAAEADITAVLNEECAALHELMVDAFQDYSVTSGQVTMLADTDSIALPSATYKVRAVQLGGPQARRPPLVLRIGSEPHRSPEAGGEPRLQRVVRPPVHGALVRE
jgi:hypothetical protein